MLIMNSSQRELVGHGPGVHMVSQRKLAALRRCFTLLRKCLVARIILGIVVSAHDVLAGAD
jgi:hypothetical protein